jgi:hypothetical protein
MSVGIRGISGLAGYPAARRPVRGRDVPNSGKWESPNTDAFGLSLLSRSRLVDDERDGEHWRDAIERLREESNDVLREIWAAKRRGLEDPDDKPARPKPPEPPER